MFIRLEIWGRDPLCCKMGSSLNRTPQALYFIYIYIHTIIYTIYIFIHVYIQYKCTRVCVTAYIVILWRFWLLKLYALQFNKVGW